MSSPASSPGRITKGWAIAALAVLLFAVPAAAGILVQNFLRADITVSAACFTKTAGLDDASTSGLLTFDGTTTVVDPTGGVQLLQETVTLEGFAGDRMLYSEAIDFNNTCGHDLTVSFISAADPAGGAAVEDTAGAGFAALDVRMYLEDPVGGGPVPGLTGNYTEMLTVIGGVAGPAVPPTVTLPDGGTLTLAMIIDSDQAGAGAAGTLRWIAAADNG